jgi:glutaconate CoA-transferase subunit A
VAQCGFGRGLHQHGIPDVARPRGAAEGLARWLLYVRSHWLRMPPHLLVPHLVRKAWMRRFPAPAETPPVLNPIGNTSIQVSNLLQFAVTAQPTDGDTVALEGFTHLIPHAAGHELIRQGRRDLTLVRMTPDVVYDQLIGAGCARKLVFSWGGNPGVGSLHRLRDAVEHGWPAPLELEEHSHAGMAAAYAAGAAHLPFGVLRGYAGTDLAARTRVATVACPFTGEELAAVHPDFLASMARDQAARRPLELDAIAGAVQRAGARHGISTPTIDRLRAKIEAA